MLEANKNDLKAFLGDKATAPSATQGSPEIDPQPQPQQTGIAEIGEKMQTGNNVLGQANDFLKNLDNLLNNPFVQKMVSGKENARKGSEPSVQQAQPQMVSSPPPQAPPPQQQQPAPQQQQAQTQQIEDKRTTPEQLHKLMVHFLKGVIDRKEDATCAELLADLQEHREEFIARVEQSIKAAQEQKADETEEEPIEEEEEDNGEDQDATN